MRQIGDLVVGVLLVMVLAAVVYFTPSLAEYMSTEGREPEASSSNHGLAFNPLNFTKGSH